MHFHLGSGGQADSAMAGTTCKLEQNSSSSHSMDEPRSSHGQTDRYTEQVEDAKLRLVSDLIDEMSAMHMVSMGQYARTPTWNSPCDICWYHMAVVSVLLWLELLCYIRIKYASSQHYASSQMTCCSLRPTIMEGGGSNPFNQRKMDAYESGHAKVGSRHQAEH